MLILYALILTAYIFHQFQTTRTKLANFSKAQEIMPFDAIATEPLQSIMPSHAIAAEPLQSIPMRKRKVSNSKHSKASQQEHFYADYMVRKGLSGAPSVHPATVASSSKAQLHGCNICGKTFSTHHALGGHKSSHNNKRTDEPTNTFKSRKRPRSLKASSETQSASSLLEEPSEDPITSSLKAPYECDICGKTFTAYQALGGHKSSHSNKRTDEPTNTVKSRKRPRRLNASSETQSASSLIEKPSKDPITSSSKAPYQCDICGKTFSAYQALGGHKSSHYYNKNMTDQLTNVVKSHKRQRCLQLFPESPNQTPIIHETESATFCLEESREIDLELRL